MQRDKQIIRLLVLIAVVGIIFLYTASCQKTDIMSKNKAIIQKALEEIWNKGNLTLADELFAAEYVWHAEPEIHGATGIKDHVAALRVGFPDFHITVEDMIAEGDKVVSRWTGGGTHKGQFMGMPPSGKRAIITGIIISRIADGKIAEEWETADQLGILQQLGVIAPMPDAPFSTLKRVKPEEFLWSNASNITGDPGKSEENKALIRREEEEVWNQGSLDALESIYSPQLIHHDPAFPEMRNFNHFKQFWTMAKESSRDYHIAIEDMIAERDKIAVRWSSSFKNIATEQPIHNTGICIFRIVDKKIVETWFSTDMLAFMQQLGLLPLPAEPALEH